MRRILSGFVVAVVFAVVPAMALAGNQQIAEEIANRLKTSGQLSDYSIGVKYQNGTAWLQGHVTSAEQMKTALRLTRRVLPTTDDYVGDALVTTVAGRTMVTPLVIVMVAIGTADVLFAVDSIPAIFGLTQETFLVFAANAFSLLGLRQLYFLVDGLLDRLVYLAYGLGAILGFIGVKLVLHALRTNEVPFVNGGEHVTSVPEIGTWTSLGFIVVALTLTTILSLDRSRRDALEAAAGQKG